MNLKERLLRTVDLNLEKAISICKSAEVAHKQMQDMDKGASVSIINHRSHRSNTPVRNSSNRNRSVSQDNRHDKRYRSNSSGRSQESSSSRQYGKTCGRCGSHHEYRKCPAFNRKCVKCGVYGHFGVVCKKRNNNLNINTVNMSELNIDTVQSKNVHSVDWFIYVKINNYNVKFKVDTGSHVDIITFKMFEKLGLRLDDCNDVKLKNFDGTCIKIEEVCYSTVIYKEHNLKLKFFVVNLDTSCILGYESAIKLGLINRVSEIEKVDCIINNYKDLFVGLGQIDYEYDIKLLNNSIPIVESPRKIPFKLENRIKEELEKLENLGVIRRVNEPTEWVNSMVVTRKKDNSVRICLDPQNLNKCIIRERYKMNTFDELVAKMPKACYFSVLDASKGFYMIKLSKKTQLLTTFNAGSLGRYCYKRLPFGLNSAPEVFSKCFADIFKDIDGVEQYIDELIVWGDSIENHDRVLKQVLERAKEAGVKFNREKCKFRVKEVKYVGHILSNEGIKPDPEKIRAIVNMEEPKSKKHLQEVQVLRIL